MVISIPAEYMHPEIMAIGDSMHQGVRSLTMKKELFQYSPPVQVAKALGATFRYPQPNKPIYVDAEEFLRVLPSLRTIDRMLAENAQYWEEWWRNHKDPSHIDESRPMFHDNIAVAQTVISDTYAFDWEFYRGHAELLTSYRIRSIKDLKRERPLDFMSSLLGLNMSYTLNPQGRPELQDIQIMDLVKARRPKQLLINIGANDGLFNVGFEANANLTPDVRDRILSRYAKLAERLAELDKRTEQIIVDTLILPSQVPNLMPEDDVVNNGFPPGPDGYYETYHNRVGFRYREISAKTPDPYKNIAAQDEIIRQVNKGMTDIMNKALGSRVAFVALDESMAKLNNKHLLGQHGEDTIKVYPNSPNYPKSISNKMIEVSGGGFLYGGFCGLDGMHPSVVGYGKIANEILRAMCSKVTIDYTDCFKQDSLLSDTPRIWALAWGLYREYRRATSLGTPYDVSDEKKGIIDMLEACSFAFRKPECPSSG